MSIRLFRPAEQFEAIRWTGRNLTDVQAFMEPASPLRLMHAAQVSAHADYKPSQLVVLVPDPIATKTYPTLGPQFKPSKVEEGDWILKSVGTNEFSVVTNAQAQLMNGYGYAPSVFAMLDEADTVVPVTPTLKDA